MAMPQNLSERQVLENKFRNSRANLLIVVLFTALNIILLITNSDVYFLFSAYVPYILVGAGMYASGKYPPEYYEGDLETLQAAVPAVFTVMLVIAAIIVALYLLSWIFSKKNRVGWLIFALVLFALDTVGMLFLGGIQLENIVDIVFHIWVIVSLTMGVTACFKLKKLPPEESEATEIEETGEAEAGAVDSQAIGMADTNVKARVLLEATALGHLITYRRVKRVNELVIDGYVYDTYEALVETDHTLTAVIDGHCIEVGFDSGARSYLKVDGEMVAKKLRLY